ncbi:hypothetical protein PHLGIDRAFT_74704, partial [Phlebiopsis gigantea 11061_1 CR5-6]
ICFVTQLSRGRVGGAYYDPTICKLYVLDDSQESSHYDLTRMLTEQAEAAVILVSSKADDGCMDVLRSQADASDSVFRIRPHKDFIPAKGRARILSLRLLTTLPSDDIISAAISAGSSDSEPRNAYDFMRRRRDVTGDPTVQQWNAAIRLANYASIDGSPLCLGSVGALLDYLAKLRAMSDLEDNGIGGLEIRSIEYISLKDIMQINADALYSLQVFDHENHASIHSDKTKEGLSLFGILNNTNTSLGKALLREWFTRPSMSPVVISARHDAVECFMRSENLGTVDAMHIHLKGIKNVPRILSAMKSSKAKVSDWQGLVKFAFHSVMLREALSELSQASHVEIVKKLVNALEVASFKDIGSTVNETINWEESTQAARVCVRPHIDEDLDKMKHIYNGIDSVLSKVAETVSANVPLSYTPTLNVVYFPQLGFLICVPMQDEWQNNGVDVMDGWTFQFSSEAQVYFKSQEMHGEYYSKGLFTPGLTGVLDLDKHIGDIHSAIVDREIEITQELLERILQFETAIVTSCDICAELDCLLSFADASRAYDYRRPELSEDNVTVIKQGRHPLQELVVDTFVPNDALLVGFECPEELIHALEQESDLDESMQNCRSSVMICTGPNACGKSVYLKQIALIHYMAQVRLIFVPAQSATLGIVDKIFTRIQTRESVSKAQSAFMIDLNQVSLALRNSTSRSLVLLDEFGKGTVATDGAGLFCGVIQHLLERGNICPKVIAATHFHDVFKEGMLDPGELPITFIHMQAMITSDDGKLLGMSGTEEYLQEDRTPEESDADPDARLPPGQRITYLYRVGKGLGLNSHAAVCAELFGIPRAVVRRAQYVRQEIWLSQLLRNHELGTLLDEEMTEDEKIELQVAEEVCRRFLACDLEGKRDGVDAKSLLAQVLERDGAADDEGELEYM